MRNTFQMGIAGAISLCLTALILSAASDAEAETLDPTIEFSGRLLLDVEKPFNDGSQKFAYRVRSTRLGVRYRYAEGADFKLGVNAQADSNLELADARIKFAIPESNSAIKLGRFRPRLSREASTSSRFTSVLEKSAFTSAFDLRRSAAFETTIFTGSSDFALTATAPVGTDRFASLSSRFATEIELGRGLEAHLGISARARARRSSTQDATVLNAGRFLRTESDRASSMWSSKRDIYLSGDLVVSNGRFWLALENAYLEPIGRLKESGAEGGYLEVGHFFGGVRHVQKGQFLRPEIESDIFDGGLGAFSSVLRYDHLEFSTTQKQKNWVLGLDWWPSDSIRLSANFSRATFSRGFESNKRRNGLKLRLQFDF